MNANASGKAFNHTRVFDAPRALVWQAFTEPERLALWWGPAGFEMLQATVDLRPGGLFHYGMRGPDGSVMWGRFLYREIQPPELLTYVLSFSDEAGGITRHPGHQGWPLEMLSTIRFIDEGTRTRLEMLAVPLNASESERAVFEENFEGMNQGFSGTWSQLDAYLQLLVDRGELAR
ncbi:SRPBCC domain-containing protein [Niveibacterium sp. SC-1]|uniref:SRPBCC family protein n=1 Tax=Niveibacterium sp. SC-1 TaxID=3135646 RepID=UPI00311D7333